MTAPILIPVICACSWRGELTATASCPACGLGYTHRMTTQRLAIVAAIDRGERLNIQPMTRRWLLGRKLIAPAGAVPEPRATRGPGRFRTRPFTITDAARAVLAAASRGATR